MVKISKIRELRQLDTDALDKKLADYRKELQEKYSQLSAGGSIDNPAKIRELRRGIAKILTIKNEIQE